MDLSTVRNRERLKPQREPYWQKIAKCQHLGYRPSTYGGGAWIARWYDSEHWVKRYHALGDFGDLLPSERYDAAAKAAREWFEHVSGGGSTKILTVRQVCERYAEDRPDAAARFARYVYDDPIARVPLPKLRREQVAKWRKRLESRPALVTRRKTGEPVTRKRAAATVNRDMVAFRAALNAAAADGYVQNTLAWTKPLAPIKKADNSRGLYLDHDERRALLDHLPADIAAFVRGLCMLPLRPGALAAAQVRDFDPRRNELVIVHDKAGAGRKFTVNAETAALLKAQSRGKLPGAPLFARADGKAWGKDTWKHPIKDAVRAAGLPHNATAYTLRHSTITDLVTNGVDLFTVASTAGTSIKMIQEHYRHALPGQVVDAHGVLAL